MTMPERLSLAEVVDSRLAISSPEAVAIVVQLARSPQMGRPRPVPFAAEHLWLESDGSVTLAPGIMPRPSEVATLLEEVLAPLGDDVPRALRTILSRAAFGGAGTPVPTLSALAAVLAPFQPPDPAAAVRGLVTRYHAPHPVVQPAAAAAAVAQVPQIAPAAVTAVEETPARIVAPAAAAVHEQETRREPVAPWRPSGRHIGAAAAAALLAAVLGGLLARTRDVSPPLQASATAAPAASSATPLTRIASETVPQPDEPGDRATTAPDPVPAAPAAAPQPEPEPEPARDAPPDHQPAPMATTPAATSTEAASLRPARLVDRRDADAEGVFSPSFAANGSAVFFHAESGSGSALKRADAAGGELRVASIVDDGARNYHVQLSPDGTQVAFDSDRDGVRGVYVAGADGRGVRRISGDGYAAVPTWSPDGRQLAFLRAEANRPAVWNLWIHDRASGRERRLTSFRRGQVWGGSWFADGRRIAYSHEDRLRIRDLETGDEQDIASPRPGKLVRTPAVSPDGRWIIFQVFRDGVWLFDVDGGTMTRVLDDPSAEEFAWAPDGRRFAYHSRRSGGWSLWTMARP